jgi:DNA-binding response OmpR family regulator
VIVEDEPEIAEVLQITLEQHGFQVIVLGNGSLDALVSLCPQEPHLLVCDLKLPGGSGAELCGLVMERYPQCEIILMTGAVDVRMPSRFAVVSTRQSFCASPFAWPSSSNWPLA